MTVVVYELNENSEYEAIGSHTDNDSVDNEELLAIYPEEVWQDRTDEWLSERLDGPYIMAGVQDEEPSQQRKVSMWTEYVGPNGGEGYQHLMTDEVRYVDEEPTSDEAPGNDVDVDEPNDGELNEMTGISDASFIEDNVPVTATWENLDGESFVGQIEEVDYGGFDETFVIAATNGRRYEVEGDNLTGYIEPTPEYNPETNEQHQRQRQAFEQTNEELPDGVIPERPVPNMGNGGPSIEPDQFRHIGTGRIGQQHVERLQEIIDSGDTGNIQIGIESVGDTVDYGPWEHEDGGGKNYFDGGQFAHVDVEMPTEDFLATQADMLSSDRNHPQDAYEGFYNARTDDVKEYAEVLQEQPGELPMPYIEFGRNGNMRNQQEGRHRALAARLAGLDTIPVRMVINSERDGKGAEDRVDWGQDLNKALEKKDWRPYYGPRGGEGWIRPSSFSDDKIVYDDEAPGSVNGSYDEDYWEDRPSPADPELAESVASFLDDAKPRSFAMDDPATNFIETAVDAGYEASAIQDTLEWYLMSRDAYVGDGVMEQDDVRKIISSASTEFIDRHTATEVEIEGGKRGVGSISLGRIDSDFKRDWWENFESEMGYDESDNLPEQEPAYAAIRNWSMTSRMYSQSTAPLIKAAIQESDNEFIPVNGEEVRETEVTDREIEHVNEYSTQVTELYREIYGDTVPCFRGIDGESSQIEGLKEDIRNGNAVDLPEATLSSWATEPSTALEFAGEADRYESEGVLIRQQVPVENIFVSGDTHPGLLSNENELVINAPESVTRYKGDQLAVPSETSTLEQSQWAIQNANKDTDASEEAAKAVQRALLSKEEANEYFSLAVENYDWFRRMGNERTEEKSLQKEWIPYEGPRGGEGWQNTSDRTDIRYDLEDPPGEIEDGYEEMAEGWGQSASDESESNVEIPEKFEGEYAPEDITPIPGDPSEWGDEFPISEGQTLLGQNWEWDVERVWYQDSDTHSPEPRMELAIPTGISHTFGYVSDSVKLQGMDPGWHKNPSIPDEDSQQEFVGVVGEPQSENVGFNPTGEAANAAFNLDEAAARMASEVSENNWEEYDASEYYVADLLEEHDPNYETLKSLVTHGLEANGERLREERDISTAEDVILNGIKIHLNNQEIDHPTLDGKISLGDRDDDLFEDFQSRMTSDTREEVNNAMASWISGMGSMVDEDTIPIYRQAAQAYENDFYPTRGNVEELIDSADNLEERQEQFERYRQKTVETFREVFGDTVPVFRGYDPGEQSKGAEAREALQAEDGPTEIEIRNGVANSWSTDPTIAHKFSTWNNDDTPGIVVRHELPVEQIFGSSDTAADVRSDEAEIVAGHPKEFTTHSRDDVFLPEEFDAIEQMRWALSGIENDASEEEEKADKNTLSLDWELESVGWMNEYRQLEEALSEKNWTPIDVGDQSGYQHVVSGETVVAKAGIPLTNTARQAGHKPLSKVLIDSEDVLGKAWVPYQGPRGGSGWRNTTTENIRYDLDEKPEPKANDPDDLTEENVEDAQIQQSFGLMRTTAHDLMDGEKLHFEIQGHPYETRVQEVTDNAIHAVDTETHREFEIPVDERGKAENGLTLASPQAVFFGNGIAASESTWLPEEGEPNQTELKAEALRSAASTDDFGDTSYIEGFAARASEQGANEETIVNATRNALEEHPALQPDMAEQIYQNGQRLLEIEESLTDKALTRSYPITPIRNIRKEWIPYKGPQEGEGWQNANNPDDVRYTDDAPGPVADGYEEQAEDWGGDDESEPERVQGATVLDWPISGSDDDLRLPKNYTAEDLTMTLRRFRAGDGDLSMLLEDKIASDIHLDRHDKTDVLRATAEVLETFAPEDVSQFNDLLHEEIANTPNADFDVPFGTQGPQIHDALEDTFGRMSEIVGELEDMVLFDDSVDEDNADSWIVAAEGWIRHNGDRRMADEFREALDNLGIGNPFMDTDTTAEQNGISSDVDPTKAQTIAPISETQADTGISSGSMFIAGFEDGHRAFITNTSRKRAVESQGIETQDAEDASRAMAGYEAFQAADMEVPRHERLEGEYWTVKEAEGTPAKDVSSDVDIDRDEFYKLGAVAMLSGNWDLHGGNVFVTPDNNLVPVDLDLSGHDMQARSGEWRNTSWGRLRRLGENFDMEIDEIKRGVVQATEKLVEDGTADDIKSVASNVDNKDIEMAITENVFAAKGGRLYDDDIGGSQ